MREGGPATNLRKFAREMFGLFLIFCALFLLLALFSFDANDPSVNYVKSGEPAIQNLGGLFGAYAAGFLNDFFGIGSLLWPLVLAILGAAHVSAAITLHWWRWAGFFLITICMLMAASSLDIGIGDLAGGGMVGRTLLTNSVRYLSPIGSALLFFFVLLAGIQLAANFSWLNLAKEGKCKIQHWWQTYKSRTPGEAPAFRSLPQVFSHISSRLKISDLATKRAALIERGKEFGATLLARFSKKKDPIPSLSPMPPEEESCPSSSIPDITIICPPPNTPPEARSIEEIPASPAADLSGEAPGQTTVSPELPEEPAPPAPVFSTQVEQVQETGVPVHEEPKAPPPVAPMITPIFTEDPVFPGPELLNRPKPVVSTTPEDLEARGRALMTCFNDFGVQGELAKITPGPVVTMFEVRPAAGIRVSRIANLADDLSLALKAIAVRIQAPIPGSDTVGIEIPNATRETVNFREIVECPEFRAGIGPLTMILGKNIAGFPFLADLAKMPHMLVAGATGAGKSVCLNSILVSLLYRVSPKDMRLLLVDPKRIELAVYADLPHLVHPVVTEMDDAKNALEWAVQDMTNRYKTFERLGVRNIVAYHQKLASFGGKIPEEFADLGHMPYMVIVIDELADLMMTAARDVEMSIVRLAQLARAAGIHMILATQRPSVDVVTGLIKANFPCRISFQVTSKHDSRTILDQVGAEHLLGRGDMLFKPSGGKLIRLHGPFLSDEEVQAVATHWKQQMAPDYQIDFSQWSGEAAQTSSGNAADNMVDPLYDEAREFVLQEGRASISLLQRHLRIGFNRAARLVEQFEKDGIVGPADGSKPRSVIR